MNKVNRELIDMGRMSFWRKHYLGIDEERKRATVDPDSCKNELGAILKELADKRFAPRAVVGWLYRQNGKTVMVGTECTKISFSDRAVARAGKHPAVPLQNLSSLQNGALLTLSVSISPREHQLLGYNIGIQGCELGTNGRRWYARIDLHEAPNGHPPKVSGGGYCNHALVHCQFGADPNDSAELPVARAPLPWLMPWDALRWVLATVEHSLEPDPF